MIRRMLILLQSDYPPDVRLHREMQTLLQAGLEIHLLCNNRKALPLEEHQGRLTIHRMRNITRKDSWLHRFLAAPVVINPLWICKTWSLIRRHRIDLVYVVNLPLAPLAVWSGRRFRIPVIYDMYETYPEAIRSWRLRGLKRLTRNVRLAQWLDDRCARGADRLVVVVEEAKERLVGRGIPSEKIHVIPNTVDLRDFRVDGIDETLIRRFDDRYCLVYTGLFSPERGLETAIEAMPLIRREIPNALLLLVGDGPSRKGLMRFVTERGLDDHVHFTGWVDYRLFPTYVALAKICLIPQPSNPFIDTTIPNKLFEYMAMGRPVLASDAKPLKRIIHAWGCGETFRSGSPEDFAKAVFRIRGHERLLGENGKKAVQERFQWALTEKAYLRVFRSLSHPKPGVSS